MMSQNPKRRYHVVFKKTRDKGNNDVRILHRNECMTDGSTHKKRPRQSRRFLSFFGFIRLMGNEVNEEEEREREIIILEPYTIQFDSIRFNSIQFNSNKNRNATPVCDARRLAFFFLYNDDSRRMGSNGPTYTDGTGFRHDTTLSDTSLGRKRIPCDRIARHVRARYSEFSVTYGVVFIIANIGH